MLYIGNLFMQSRANLLYVGTYNIKIMFSCTLYDKLSREY